MSEITLKGNKIHTGGTIHKIGDTAPPFTLTGTDLSEKSLSDFSGKRVILNIFPSLDTPVCAMSVRRFNSEVTKLENTVVLSISRDLPFAHQRFCAAEGIENVVSLSELRDTQFGKDYGLTITDGPLAGLLARAVVVIDTDGTVIHSQLVPEIGEEPDYDRALKALE